MKLDSEHLEILAVIVECRGLVEAAERLGKSQPSVSRTMALLEARIGSPLFEPGRRPLRPTELGQSLARIGAGIHAANAEARQLISRYSRGHVGRLRIGGTPIFLDGVISGMIAEFQNCHPDVLIEQSYGYLGDLAGLLRSGGLDMAILPLGGDDVPDDLVFTPVLPGRNVIACRSGHPLMRKQAIRLADLEAFSWIAPPSSSPLHRDLMTAWKAMGRDSFPVRFSGGTLASIQSVLSGSDALTVLPYSVVFMARRRLAIDALPIHIGHPERRLGILHCRDRTASPAQRQLQGWLVTELERLHARIEHEQQVTRRRG